MDNVEFDAPEIQGQLEQTEAPPSAFSQNLGRIIPAPPRVGGGIPKPYTPTISPRQVTLHSYHLAQDVVMPGCPLCPPYGQPLIESKKVHDFGKKDVVEDDVPQWFIYMCRNWPGGKRTVTITLEDDRRCNIHAYPAEWSIAVRHIAWRLFPIMKAHPDVRSYKIPDDLQKYVPIIKAQVKARVKEFLSEGNSRKPGRKPIRVS